MEHLPGTLSRDPEEAEAENINQADGNLDRVPEGNRVGIRNGLLLHGNPAWFFSSWESRTAVMK